MPIKHFLQKLVRTAASILVLSGMAAAQSTIGWLTFNGSAFSFNYPPDWKISAQTATNVQLINADMAFSVTYTTAFGTNINEALTSVESGTQKFATAHGYTLVSDPFVPGSSNGVVSVLMHLTGSGLSPLDVWGEAQSSGSAIFLTELVGTPDEVFTNEVTVAWPLSRSVHSLVGQSVVGSWSATVSGVGSLPTPEQYQVTLIFNTDGTYTYHVRQTDAPAWDLQVAGTYTSAPANQNNDNYPLVVQLIPQNVNPTGISNLQIEGIRLVSAGLPVTDAAADDQFFAEVDTDGSLLLVRPGSPPLRLTKAAAILGVTPTTSTGPFHLVPVTPCRVADTRSPSASFGATLGKGDIRDFSIPLSTCGIPSTARAYSLNVTAVPIKELGYISIWPTGEPQPYVSTLNSYDGRFKANAVLVQAGQNASVSVFASDATDIVLDINGYWVPADDPSGMAFYPLPPCRISDTRNPDGPLGGPMLADKQTRTIPVTSSPCGVPDNAQAYSLNFTAVPQGTLGYLSVWPTGEAQPYVSTLNAPTGTPTANAAIVPAGGNGSIDVYVSQASDVVIDVNGYFAPPIAGALSFYGLAPCRVWDTRATGTKQPLTGSASVPVVGSSCAIPITAQAVVFNATVVPQGSLGYLSLWPAGGNQPLVSTLNAWDASVVSNMAIVPLASGAVNVFTSDPTHTILDASGYFAP